MTQAGDSSKQAVWRFRAAIPADVLFRVEWDQHRRQLASGSTFLFCMLPGILLMTWFGTPVFRGVLWGAWGASALLLIYSYRESRRAIAKFVGAYAGERHFRISERGVTVRRENMCASTRWDGLTRRTVYGDYWLLSGPSGSYLVPVKDSEPALQRFVLRRLTGAVPEVCPKCEFDLRAQTERRCPECGATY